MSLALPPVPPADYTFVLTCKDDALYCLEFPPSPTAGGGASSPSLCLPLPPGCGAAGGACCPLTGDKDNRSQRCQEDGTICLAPNSTTIYGNLTYDTYRQLLQAPETVLPNATALSVFGTCQVFPEEACGQEGGLCGPLLPKGAPDCPKEKRSCPSW